jgi:hypothetical protein
MLPPHAPSSTSSASASSSSSSAASGEYDPALIDQALIAEAADLMRSALSRAMPDDDDHHNGDGDGDESNSEFEDDEEREIRTEARARHAAAWVEAVWRGLHLFLARRCGGRVDAPLARALQAALVAVSRADLNRSALKRQQRRRQRRQLQRYGASGSGISGGSACNGGNEGTDDEDEEDGAESDRALLQRVSRGVLRAELVQHLSDLLIDDMMYSKFVAQVHICASEKHPRCTNCLHIYDFILPY